MIPRSLKCNEKLNGRVICKSEDDGFLWPQPEAISSERVKANFTLFYNVQFRGKFSHSVALKCRTDQDILFISSPTVQENAVYQRRNKITTIKQAIYVNYSCQYTKDVLCEHNTPFVMPVGQGQWLDKALFALICSSVPLSNARRYVLFSKVQAKYYAYTITFQAQIDSLPWTPLAQFGTQCMWQGAGFLFHHRWGDTDVIHSSKRLGRRIRCKTNTLLLGLLGWKW